jgi:FixJ family two-component response regulator
MKAFGWIAIVDDDPSVLKALGRLLRVRGIQAKTYGTAEEFVAALPDGLPECAIIDLQLPGMTGLELLQYLKRRGMEVPSIIITARADAGTRERCEAAGAVAFFSKPFKNAALLAAVDDARR